MTQRKSWSSGLARASHSADTARPMKSRRRFCIWLPTTRPFLQALRSWLMEEPPGLRWALLSIGADERSHKIFDARSRLCRAWDAPHFGLTKYAPCDCAMTSTSEQEKSFLAPLI